MAVRLLAHAVAALPPVAAGTNSSSNATNSTNSSSSGLTAKLWEQIKQSGFLQELHNQLNSNLQDLHSSMAAHPSDSAASKMLAKHTTSLLEVLVRLRQVHPSFLLAQAAGHQCVLTSLQCISTVMAQAGLQEWMEGWMICSWNAGWFANSAALYPSVEALRDQLAGGSGSSSSSSQHDPAVLQAEPTVQWCCLEVLKPMLSQFLLQAAGTEAASGRSGTSSSNSSRTSSRTSRQTSSASMPGGASTTLPVVASSSRDGCF
jgi:hypothetical protein